MGRRRMSEEEREAQLIPKLNELMKGGLSLVAAIRKQHELEQAAKHTAAYEARKRAATK